MQKIGYFCRGFCKFLRELPKADIVHIHLAAVERKMPFVFLAKLFGKKIIIHFHFPDPATTLDNPHKAWKYGWCIKKADVVIALSETWKKLLTKKYQATNIIVLHNPCPKVGKIEPYSDKLRHNKYILYAGNLSVRKGYGDLLKAFANVQTMIPGWTIKFAGNGDIDNAKSMSKELGIENYVEFLGWITGDQKDKAFSNAACYCLPSYAEGFPMGVLDSWAYGLPVITTPVGGLPDILKDSENALVFSPGNIKELESKLLRLKDDALLEKLSIASLNLAKGPFNIDTINNSLGEIYYKLSENKNLQKE